MCRSVRHHLHAAKCGWLSQGLHEGATDRRTALLICRSDSEGKTIRQGLSGRQVADKVVELRFYLWPRLEGVYNHK